ncbi:MAG TPA: hypothetical protein VGR16_11930 [Thermomicrobiales bacterium]|nr:hypothetical protein [Thermomicrobiales bacterium]
MNLSPSGPTAEVFDVTAPLATDVAVWPGDPAIDVVPSSRVAEGVMPCNISRPTCVGAGALLVRETS